MRRSRLLCTFASLLCGSLAISAESPVFSASPSLVEIPAGRLKAEIAQLPPAAQARALSKLSRVPVNNIGEIHTTASGEIFYRCEGLNAAQALAAAEDAPLIPTGKAPVPVSSPPIFHSKAGAPNTLYLDFNGAVIASTEWNDLYDVASWTAKAFSADADFTTFSDAEQQGIALIWQRVAEDYSSFDIDVTTEEPTSFTNNTGWVLFTSVTDADGVDLPHKGSGGIAFVGVFGNSDYHARLSPAFVTDYGMATNRAFFAESDAAAHEFGHNLGLSHDGNSRRPYESGFPATATSPSWGPIMGAPYGMDVSHWCKGDYFDANNTEDDLAIISSHLSYRTDDHGNSADSPTNINARSNSFSVKGIIERTSDVDFFRVFLETGAVTIKATPAYSLDTTSGGNVDLQLSLIDASGTVLATANGASQTSATVTATVTSGPYTLKVQAVGAGSPLATTPSGYVPYGSLGQYTLLSGDGDTTGGTTAGGGTGTPINPQAEPGTGEGVTGGSSANKYQAPASDGSGGCGLGAGSLALIVGLLGAFAMRRRLVSDDAG